MPVTAGVSQDPCEAEYHMKFRSAIIRPKYRPSLAMMDDYIENNLIRSFH